MNRIKPAWEGEKTEELLVCYYYLLYQTLPFAPSAFLPQDENGYYYHESGDVQLARIYPTEPRKKWCLHKGTTTFLNEHSDIIAEYCKSKSAIFAGEKPQNVKEIIYLVSIDLYNMLYDSGMDMRSALRKLLFVTPNEKTVKTMEFALNTEPLNGKMTDADRIKRYKKGLLEMLYSEIFNYDSFSRKELFSELVQLLGVEVCPYCNRTFTTTVRSKRGTFYRQNQVDHYAPRSKYPWFALSLKNLIPVCGNCNQRKGDTDEFVLYPYEESFGNAYSFKSVPVLGIGYLIGQPASESEFRIEIDRVAENAAAKDSSYHEHVQNSIKRFGLDALYSESHNTYIAAIYKQHYIFNDAYVDSLVDSFEDVLKTRDDFWRMLYLKEYDDGTLDKTPLAKLTHDIDREISELSK